MTLAACLLGVQIYLCSQIQALDTAFVEMPRTQVEKINPILFKTLSFGHYAAAVDGLLLKFLSDPAYIHVEKGEHPPAYFDLDLATDLDPLFFELYSTGANFLAVIRDDGIGAKNLLLKAVRVRDHELPSEEFRQKYWSRGWHISALLGYVNLFELHDMPSAAAAFAEGARLPGAPPVFLSLGAQLATPEGQYKVGARILNMMIENEKIPESKEKLIAKRESLFIGAYLSSLNQSFQHYPSHQKSLEFKWNAFVKSNRLTLRDPWGGVLSLGPEGRIESSTPHQKVMGLD